jgi:hypothetical protein
MHEVNSSGLTAMGKVRFWIIGLDIKQQSSKITEILNVKPIMDKNVQRSYMESFTQGILKSLQSTKQGPLTKDMVRLDIHTCTKDDKIYHVVYNPLHDVEWMTILDDALTPLIVGLKKPVFAGVAFLGSAGFLGIVGLGRWLWKNSSKSKPEQPRMLESRRNSKITSNNNNELPNHDIKTSQNDANNNGRKRAGNLRNGIAEPSGLDDNSQSGQLSPQKSGVSDNFARPNSQISNVSPIFDQWNNNQNQPGQSSRRESNISDVSANVDQHVLDESQSGLSSRRDSNVSNVSVGSDDANQHGSSSRRNSNGSDVSDDDNQFKNSSRRDSNVADVSDESDDNQSGLSSRQNSNMTDARSLRDNSRRAQYQKQSESQAPSRSESPDQQSHLLLPPSQNRAHSHGRGVSPSQTKFDKKPDPVINELSKIFIDNMYMHMLRFNNNGLQERYENCSRRFEKSNVTLYPSIKINHVPEIAQDYYMATYDESNKSTTIMINLHQYVGQFYCLEVVRPNKTKIPIRNYLELTYQYEFTNPNNFDEHDHWKPLSYNLIATLHHNGHSGDSGHYYACVRSGTNSWFVIDDMKSSIEERDSIDRENVVWLFYEKHVQSSLNYLTAEVYRVIKNANNICWLASYLAVYQALFRLAKEKLPDFKTLVKDLGKLEFGKQCDIKELQTQIIEQHVPTSVKEKGEFIEGHETLIGFMSRTTSDDEFHELVKTFLHEKKGLYKVFDANASIPDDHMTNIKAIFIPPINDEIFQKQQQACNLYIQICHDKQSQWLNARTRKYIKLLNIPTNVTRCCFSTTQLSSPFVSENLIDHIPIMLSSPKDNWVCIALALKVTMNLCVRLPDIVESSSLSDYLQTIKNEIPDIVSSNQT